MMSQFTSLLDQILLQVSSAQHKKPDRLLTAFHPVRGEKAIGELMVVGRAVNGWGDGWTPAQATSSKRREDIIHKVLPTTYSTNACPMQWVSDRWGRTGFWCPDCKALHAERIQECSCGGVQIEKVYNTAKSSFWRVIRGVVMQLGIADDSASDWPSRLIWTDLYKIAPCDGGNPNSALKSLQQQLCIQLLTEEVNQWQPRRILFLTGLNWARPFLEGLGFHDSTQLDGRVEWIGRMQDGPKALIVVGPHPQGKPESDIVREIEIAFKSPMG